MYLSGMRKRLGLKGEREGDALLVSELLDAMEAASADWLAIWADLEVLRTPAVLAGWASSHHERLVGRSAAANPAGVLGTAPSR